MTEDDSPVSSGSFSVVIGAGGGLGSALLARLRQRGNPGRVIALGRSADIPINYFDEASIAHAAQAVASACAGAGAELRLLLVASGFLHGQAGQPERSWSQLDAAYLHHVFTVNTFGPALVMKHFFPLLPKRGRCVAGFVSAKVGSIGDNALGTLCITLAGLWCADRDGPQGVFLQPIAGLLARKTTQRTARARATTDRRELCRGSLGGWYGYRASKAALNQLVKTAVIELTRRNRESVCVALHPGTVDTLLSQPFSKAGLRVRSADEAAGDLLGVLDQLSPAESGGLVDYRGHTLPF